jgi:DNA-binding beta-propeller fold protein YncE
MMVRPARSTVLNRVLLILLLLTASAPAGAQTPRFLLAWGSRGSLDGQFWIAWDVVVDGSGYVYVTDASSRVNRIQKFTENGTFVSQWGSGGSGNGEFLAPRGIAIDGAERLYVCDTHNHRVQKFDTDGTYLGEILVPDFEGAPAQPYGVALDGGGNIYVSDLTSHSILKFDPQGVLLTRWGGQGSGPGQFDAPWSVAVDDLGHVYVVDNQNHRVQKFGPNGEFLGAWGGEPGTGPGQFTSPRGVAVDEDRNVYVTDTVQRVQKFTPEGQFIFQFGRDGIRDGEFEFPTGLVTHRDGGVLHIYVVDQESNRMQKFGDETVPAFPTTWGRIKAIYR